LSSVHAIDLLGGLLSSVLESSGVDPREVGQVVGGCVGQVGMQAMNVTRNAWLRAGLPLEVAASTVDAQCGSSQQATNVAYSLVASGMVECAVACGVEVMSRVPMGSTIPRDPDVGKPINRSYWEHYEFTSQFEGAERMARRWGITRGDCDDFGLLSQERAARAWAEDRFASQVLPVTVGGEDGERVVVRDEGLRETSLEALAGLSPNVGPDGVHTAGTSSQIADGAGAVILMSADRAAGLGLTPQASIVDACLVGCDPVLMLEGPIPATRRLLAENGLGVGDIDMFEINEAFA